MLCTRPNRLSPLLLLAFLVLLTTVVPTVVALALPNAPKTFNIYIRKHYEAGDDTLLAKWDYLALDMETPDSMLVLIKAANPNCKLLAFCPLNGTYDQSMRFPVGNLWRVVFETAAANNWWLRNTNGGQVKDHGNKFTTNLTLNCPPNGQGQTIHDWFPGFIVNTVLRNGASPWDGVLLDDCWVGIWWVSIDTYLNPYPIDSDLNGVADPQGSLDASYQAGSILITQRIRNLMPSHLILTGNGQNRWYHMNGAMIENFPYNNNPDPGSPANYSWNYTMFQDYSYFLNEDSYSNQPARANFINVKWSFGSRYSPTITPEFERHKRFCLGSSMLRDGYFSLDLAQAGVAHNSIWWLPEYNKPIGTPIGPPYQANYGTSVTVWRRDYTNGSVIVNPNYVSFPGAPADSLPPISWLDAAILLSTEFWHPDLTPPSPIVDLMVESTWPESVLVRWTNMPDDRSYTFVTNMSLRYSLNPITDANFFQATRVLPPPVPGQPTTTQTAMIRGLQPNTTYYVAARIWDDSGNGSLISNVPTGFTVLSDLTPPGSARLNCNHAGIDKARLTWISPGDDDMTGTPVLFDMRYATVPLTETTWASATPIADLPAPLYAGARYEWFLSGLVPDQDYYVALRALDDAQNWSALEPIHFRTADPATVKRSPYDGDDDLDLPQQGQEIGVTRYLALSAPNPNPMNGSGTVVSLVVPANGVDDLGVSIFDSRGRQVRVLHSGAAGGGRYDFHWDGTDAFGSPLPAGVYFASMRAGRESDVRKIVRR